MDEVIKTINERTIDFILKKSPPPPPRTITMTNRDLTQPNLPNTNWSNLTLIDVNLSKSVLTNSIFTNTIFTRGLLSEANLSGADLSRANLQKADLTQAQLSKANLIEANLSGANLTGANLSGANLQKADLREAKLIGANLTGANLTGANLTGANLSGANLIGADLSNAKLIGANLTGANLSLVNLIGANLTGAILFGAKLYKSNFQNNTILNDINISITTNFGETLENANFSGINFNHLSWHGGTIVNCNFTNANLSSSENRVVDEYGDDHGLSWFTEATFNHCDFTNADLRRIEIINCIFIHCNFTGANLTDLMFDEKSNFDDCDFTGANLTNVTIPSKSIFSDCIFRQANLTNTIFTGAYIEGSIFSTTVPPERLAGTVGTPIFNDPPPPPATPLGVAYEIHNASDKYIDKCIKIISPRVNPDEYYTQIPNIIDSFIKPNLVAFIDSEYFEGTSDEKTETKNKLTAIFDKARLSEVSVKRKIDSGKSIGFVMEQSAPFINFYINAFVEDCFHAYAGPNGMSCVKGIYERFPMMIGPSAYAMCPELETCEDEIYKELIEAFELGKQLDFNKLLQEWMEKVNSNKINLTGIPETEEKIKVIKQDLIEFIKSKYAEIGKEVTNEFINDKIKDMDYVFQGYVNTEEISFGGNKQKKIKKTRKKNLKKSYKNTKKRKFASK